MGNAESDLPKQNLFQEVPMTILLPFRTLAHQSNRAAFGEALKEA